jgi:hypothetical protein
MTTNGDTEPAPDRVTVALCAQVGRPRRREAVLEFGQFQMLLRRATDPDWCQREILLTN